MMSVHLDNKFDSLAFALLSLSISAVYLGETTNFPHRVFPVADALFYTDTANAVEQGNWNVLEEFSLSRIYVFILLFHLKLAAFVSSIIGQTISPFELVYYSQSILWSVAVGLTVCLAGTFSRPVGVLSGMFLCVFGPIYFFQSVAVPIAFVTALSAISLVLFVHHARDSKLIYLLFSALLLGISIDLRPHFMILLPVLTITLFLDSPLLNTRTKIYQTGLFGVTAILPTLIISFVLSYDLNSPKLPVRSSFGLNLYMGNHTGATGLYKKIPEINNEPQFFQKSSKQYAESISGRSLSDAQVNIFWTSKVIEFYRERPFEGAKLMAQKFQHLISSKEFPVNYDYSVQKKFSTTLSVLIVNFGILLPISLIFLFQKTESREVGRIKIWFIAYAASLLIFFIASDHRLPLLVHSVLLASMMMTKLYQDLRSQKYRQVIVAILGISILSWISLSDSKKWPHHHTYHQIGEMSLILHNPEFAKKAFVAAIKENPQFLPSIERLAEINLNLGEFENATKWYRSAINLNSNNKAYLHGLAVSLYLSGRKEDAINIVEKVLKEANGMGYLDSLSSKFVLKKVPEQ